MGEWERRRGREGLGRRRGREGVFVYRCLPLLFGLHQGC